MNDALEIQEEKDFKDDERRCKDGGEEYFAEKVDVQEH
jgi:hypothetical protein